GKPFAGAFLTVLVGVGLQFLVGLLLPIGQALIAPSSISWSGLSRIPPAVWLSFNLGVSPAVIILTGFFWIRLSVRFAARAVDTSVGSARNKMLEAAVKYAVVYALLELAIAIVLKQNSHGPGPQAGVRFAPQIGAGIEPVAAFFYGLLIGFVAGVYLFARSADVRLRDLWPLRFETQVPEVARTTWSGLVTTLKIAIPGMMVFTFVASILLLQSEGAPWRIVVA